MKFNKKVIFLIATFIVIITDIILSLFNKLKSVDPKTFLQTVTLLVSIIGIFSETQKEKNNGLSIKALEKNYTLNISFESGVYGGLIGGVLSGITVAISFYYHQVDAPLKISLTIIPYCAMIGCLFGGLIALGRRFFVQLQFLNILWANFFGCLTASIIAGCFSGMLGMWLFGTNNFAFIGYNKIVIASIIAAICMILGSLIYDYEGKIKYIFISILVALFLSMFISMIGYLLISNNNISDYLSGKIYSENLGDLIEGGLIVGLINGFVFGLVIGFTVIFYKYWRFAEKQQKMPAANKSITVH